jgi:microcystin degradation protein MlrC
MKNIFVASFMQESNTFCPIKCSYDDFTVITGQDMLSGIAVSEIFGKAGYELIPSVKASALPGGVVEEQTYLKIEKAILDKIPDDDSIAGVWLYLHGAMQAENTGSADARLVSEIRKKIGQKIPIAVALDFHANITDSMIDSVNIICGYKTAPHTDQKETQIKAASLLIYCMENRIMPKPVLTRIPLLLPGEMATTGSEPVRSLMKEVEKIENEDNVLCASFFCGMAWVDSPYSGAGIVTVLKNGGGGTVPGACRAASLFFKARNRFRFEEEAAAPAKALEIALKTGCSPVFITDSGDNVTAGAPGDSVACLELLLGTGAENVLIAGITDAPAVYGCMKHRVGDIVNISLGGTLDPDGHRISVSGTVIWKGQVLDTLIERKTRSAVLRIGSIDIVITERRCAFVSPRSFGSAGLDIAGYHIIIVKQGYLFSELRKVSCRTIMALTDGSSCLDIERFEYKQVKRPIYPLDKTFECDPVFKDIL